MSADHDPTDLVARLRALGQQPVDPSLQSEQLTAIASVRPGGSVFRTSLAGRLKVAAGVFAGFLIGATGLTTAGAMGPLQPTAAKVVEAVAPVDVPRGKSAEAKAKVAERKAARGADAGSQSRLADGSIGTARIWAGCAEDADGGFAGNRGLYLKQERAKGAAAFEAAKASDCGKPVEGDESDDPAAAKAPDAPEGEGKGRDGEVSGKETAPGRDGERGQSETKKPADAGPPAVAPADDAGRPESLPAQPLPDEADDEATDKAPEHAPGPPAEAGAGPEDA